MDEFDDGLRHDEVEELLGAYALDAVDDAERAAVDAHLLTCPRCRAEVDGHREVAAHLAQTGAPAPEELWSRIAEAIDGEPAPPLRLVLDDGRRAAGRAPRRWATVPLAAAAAVVVVALLAAGAALFGSGDEGRDVVGLQAAALRAFESPAARTADLTDDRGVVLARVAVLEDGSGFLLAGALPDLAAGTYQLWGSDGDAVVSLGAIGGAPEVVAFHADPTQTALMISEEEAPVEQPTGPPVAGGELRDA